MVKFGRCFGNYLGKQMRVSGVGVRTVWQLSRICGLVCPESVLRVFSYLAGRRKPTLWIRRRAVLELGGAAVGGATLCALSPRAWLGREVEPALCSRLKLRLTVNTQPPFLYWVTSPVVSSLTIWL